MRFVPFHAAALIGLLAMTASGGAGPDVQTIIERSVAANRANWAAASQYAYTERARDDDGTRTYNVAMLFGTPYKRLVMVDGKALTADEDRKEEEHFAEERTHRRGESTDERAERVRKYARTRERAHRILGEMSRAFIYHLVTTRRNGSRTIYVIEATPRPAYDPPDTASEILTGMRGEFWIDAVTYQWVKATAHVFKPVSILGFLAEVQPGTEFELEQMPVTADVWLPRHLQVRSRSKIGFFFHHHTFDERTYSHYHRVSGS